MNPGLAFTLSFLGTLVLLGAVVVTGRAGRRRAHLFLVLTSLAALFVTIVHAKDLGRSYDLESAGWITPLHLALAKLATASFLLPLASGTLTWWRPGARAWHRRFAYAAILLTVLAATTGTWMILHSDPLEPLAGP